MTCVMTCTQVDKQHSGVAQYRAIRTLKVTAVMTELLEGTEKKKNVLFSSTSSAHRRPKVARISLVLVSLC